MTNHARDFDTIVIGGGIVGLCASWFLAREGEAVACLDHGFDAGSTVNAGSLHIQMQSRLERMFPGRVADYEQGLPIYPLAVATWEALAAELDNDIGFAVKGGLMVAETEQDVASLDRKSARERQHGVDSQVIGQSELRNLAPYLDENLVGAAFCAREGKVDPLLANAAIRRRATSAGALLLDGVYVDRLDCENGRVRVATRGASYIAGRVIVAAGAGSRAIAATLGINLPVVAEPLHMNVTEAAEPFMPHLVQHASRPITMKQLGGGHIVIGGGWPAGAGDAPRVPAVLAGSLTGNLGLAARLVPGMADFRVLRTWAGVNPTADLLSILGSVAAAPNVHFLVPGDAGYTLGPCLARMLCEQLAGRDPGFPVLAFSPARFAAA
jgi:glycine/D-amino acid oxidase-like deaminating enzyme